MFVSINEYLANPNSSENSHCNNFYDWFCSNKALIAKQKSLDAKMRKIVKSPKIDGDNMGVFYKNNSPVCGKLYDDIRICDKDGAVIYNIAPKLGYYNDDFDKSAVYCRDNGFKTPVAYGTWDDVLAYFGVK
jgi:hypothetical protein